VYVLFSYHNCSVDHTATHTTGNSSIDTSATRDTQRPWSFCKTCVAMKFVDDNDDDKRYPVAKYFCDKNESSHSQSNMFVGEWQLFNVVLFAFTLFALF